MDFDWIHLHLMVNHFPIVLAVLGTLTALAALIWKTNFLWKYTAVTLLFAGLLAPVALLTGRQAEEEAEHLASVDRRVVHEHEERAEVAMWLSAAAGVSALLALWRPKPAWRLLMSALALAAAIALGLAALEGGKIVHGPPSAGDAGRAAVEL